MSGQKYVEFKASQNHKNTLAPNIAQHLHLRQYLGSAIVVCDNPVALLSAVRKQWLRMSRQLQTRRAATLNTEEILRYTRSIMRMQRLQFAAKTPEEAPYATIFFVSPAQLRYPPPECYSLYLVASAPDTIEQFVSHMPDNALIVSYHDESLTEKLTLQPKSKLSDTVRAQWQKVTTYLSQHDIQLHQLAPDHPRQQFASSQALDTLLVHSHSFLQLAAAFQRALDFAQPLTDFSSEEQQLFERASRLAYRVQALTPGYQPAFLNAFSDKDTYFLRDRASEIDEILHSTFGDGGGEEESDAAVSVAIV